MSAIFRLVLPLALLLATPAGLAQNKAPPPTPTPANPQNGVHQHRSTIFSGLNKGGLLPVAGANLALTAGSWLFYEQGPWQGFPTDGGASLDPLQGSSFAGPVGIDCATASGNQIAKALTNPQRPPSTQSGQIRTEQPATTNLDDKAFDMKAMYSAGQSLDCQKP